MYPIREPVFKHREGEKLDMVPKPGTMLLL